MTSLNHPLSPHLQIWKWHITMLVSILHRATGVFLSFGALCLSYWLLCVAAGPDAYANISRYTNAWFGRLMLILFVFSFFFHLCNGIRHLFWDVGMGFEKESADRTAYTVILASVILTFFSCLIGLGGAV